MYERILRLYAAGRLTEAGLARAVALGWITEGEARTASKSDMAE